MDSGEEDLSNLLNNLQPNLLNEDYVFITLEDCSLEFSNQLDPIATFKEKEGLTLVIKEEKAKQEDFEYNSEKDISLVFTWYSSFSSESVLKSLVRAFTVFKICSSLCIMKSSNCSATSIGI